MNESEISKHLSRIVEKAGALLLDMRSTSSISVEKSVGDFATNADLASQDLILEELQKSFPTVPIIAEEGVDFSQVVPSECFVVDPLDGTALYASGFDEWGVMISYLKDGRPSACAVSLPLLKKTFTAAKGRGAYCNGVKLENDPNRQNQILYLGYDVHHTFNLDELKPIRERVSPMQLFVRSVGSAASACKELAEKHLHGFYITSLCKIWDMAPMALIGEEQGGRYLAPNGQPVDWSKISVTIALARREELWQAFWGEK